MNEVFREKLRKLRDEYRDEIPRHIIRDWDPVTNFKCRKTWIMALTGRLEIGIKFGEIIDPKTIARLQRGIRRFTSESFQDKDRITSRDIRYANLLITLALGGNKEQTTI